MTTPVLVTCLTVTITMRTSSGLGSRTVGFFLHLGQLLSACVPSLLVASMDTWSECTVNWSVILWCFCFGGTLHCLHSGVVWAPIPLSLVLLFSTTMPSISPFAASLFSSSTMFLLQGPTWNQAISATAFSFISSVLYATKVAWTCALTGDTSCSVPAGPDVLGSLLIFLVCVILALTYSILVNCDTHVLLPW